MKKILTLAVSMTFSLAALSQSLPGRYKQSNTPGDTVFSSGKFGCSASIPASPIPSVAGIYKSYRLSDNSMTALQINPADGEISFTFSDTGRYVIKYSDNSGINDWPIDTVTVDCFTTTGIHENSSGNYSIFPNPSQGTITIKTGNETSVTITDNVGKIVQEKSFSNETEIIGLASGIYFATIKDGDRTSTKKIIVTQ